MPSYKECFASLALGLAPLFAIMGIAGAAGSNTVTWNGQNVYGFSAIAVAALICLIFSAILAGLQKLGFVVLGYFPRRSAPPE